MGDLMHGARNPIRERDERIAALESLLREARTELARMENALRRLTEGHSWRLIANIDKAVESAEVPRTHTETMKCKTTDCWLCHGTPPNAGPR